MNNLRGDKRGEDGKREKEGGKESERGRRERKRKEKVKSNELNNTNTKTAKPNERIAKNFLKILMTGSKEKN